MQAMHIPDFKTISLFLAMQLTKNRQRWWRHFFWNAFLTFLIVVHRNKWHVWDPETKLDKIGMFCKKLLSFEIWLNLTLDLKLMFSGVKFRNKCCHRIMRPRCLIKYVSHGTRVIFWLGDLIWPDLDLDLYLVHSVFAYTYASNTPCPF